MSFPATSWLGIGILLSATLLAQVAGGAESAVGLITLDPGHFHAGLVQKLMYPQVSPVVHVYAPDGPDLGEHLQRIEGFNTRADNPTRWQEQVYRGADFLDQMVRERAGNVVVISGNNARKTEYLSRSVAAGLNVLADKPMAITPIDFDRLRQAFAEAATRNVLLYDIMTERHEITSILQRELARMSRVFGTLTPGTPAEPAVEMESVHYFFKEVAGNPLTRPAWFFDVRQQGEAVPDVGTHLVDLVQWECFPDQALDWRKDVQVHHARRWPTSLTRAQFQRVTGLDHFPVYLQPDVAPEGTLDVFQNGEVAYRLRGVEAKVAALWRFEAPPGAKDAHYSLLRGSRAWLRIRQGPEQNFIPTLYVENPTGIPGADFASALEDAVRELAAKWPGLTVKPAGQAWEVAIPDRYRVGHEAHFAQVTESFLGYLAAGRMPPWEVPNMLAKYYTTTQAYALGHRSPD